jgi:Fe2+ or Zn2+ uptake regulation protein
MNDSLLHRLLALLESRPQGASLAEIAGPLGLPVDAAERAVRLLVRAGRVRRLHAGPGELRYRVPPRALAPRPAAATPSACRGKPRTLTARLLAVLARQRAPLRAAEVVLLAGLPEDGRSVSRVSATLCMLARRGRLRRVALPGGAVRYALPGAAADAEAPLRPRDLIDAGFRPEIPREGAARLALSEWLPARDGERPSAATVCQRLRRGWPPELAARLPPLRRQVA